MDNDLKTIKRRLHVTVEVVVPAAMTPAEQEHLFQELDYNFSTHEQRCEVVETEIEHWEETV